MTRYTQFGELQPHPPFDFNQSIAFLDSFEPTQAEQILGVSILTKAISVNGQAVVFQLRSTGTIVNPCLSYNLYSEQELTATVEQVSVEAISHYLSLNDDLSAFYRLGSEDPYFKKVLDQRYGYHQAKFPSPFECACWAILSQRTPHQSAVQQKRALMEAFGPLMRFHGSDHRAFPEAGVVAGADPEVLAGLVGNDRRAAYIQGAAHAFALKTLSALSSASDDEITQWLVGIPGIGPWSASFILIRGLGRMDKLPIGEKRLKEEIEYWYAGGQSLNDTAVQQIAESYGPWKGYWAHYLRTSSHQ